MAKEEPDQEAKEAPARQSEESEAHPTRPVESRDEGVMGVGSVLHEQRGEHVIYDPTADEFVFWAKQGRYQTYSAPALLGGLVMAMEAAYDRPSAYVKERLKAAAGAYVMASTVHAQTPPENMERAIEELKELLRK